MKKLFAIVLLALSCDDASKSGSGNPTTITSWGGGLVAVRRVDDLERHVTCWVYVDPNSGGISCLPWLTARTPDGGFEE